jgi:hypothetical protein
VRIYNRYIVSLALLFSLTTILMAAYGQNRLDVYFTVYLIETLVLTEIYVYLTPKARRGLNLISGVLFIGFIGIVAFEVYKILSD